MTALLHTVNHINQIFRSCDILNEDDKVIGSFKDLRLGEEVLARWSDNNFYKATVGYIGSDYVDKKKNARKDNKRHDVAAHSFYYPNLPPCHPKIQHTLAQLHPQPETLQSPEHQSLFSQTHDQSYLAPPRCYPALPQPYTKPLFAQPPRNPLPPDQPQQLSVHLDSDQQWKQPIPHNPTPKKSVLAMMLPSSASEKPATLSTTDTLEDEVPIQSTPWPEGGSSERLWQPCALQGAL